MTSQLYKDSERAFQTETHQIIIDYKTLAYFIVFDNNVICRDIEKTQVMQKSQAREEQPMILPNPNMKIPTDETTIHKAKDTYPRLLTRSTTP